MVQLKLWHALLLAVIVFVAVIVPVLVGVYTIAIVVTSKAQTAFDLFITTLYAVVRYAIANHPFTFYNALIAFILFLLTAGMWCTTAFGAHMGLG